MDNYKGLYYNDTKEKKLYEHGAHFKYKQLFRRLKELGGIIEDASFSISINQKNKICDNNKCFLNNLNNSNDKKLKINRENINKLSLNNIKIPKTRNKKENLFENSSSKILYIPNNSFSNKILNIKLNEKHFSNSNLINNENKIINTNNIHQNKMKNYFNNRHNSMKKITSLNNDKDKIYSNRLLISKCNDNINILYSIRNNNKIKNRNLSNSSQYNNYDFYCKSEDFSENSNSLFYLKTKDLKNVCKSKENILVNRNIFFNKGSNKKKYKYNKNLFNANITDNIIKKQLNDFNISTNLKNKNMIGINRINLINKMNNFNNKFFFHNNNYL